MTQLIPAGMNANGQFCIAQIGDTLSNIPTAASMVPPSVGVSGSKGTLSANFALADHTHASSVQRTKLTVTVASGVGTATWTFATPYATAPICIAQVENVSSPTNTTLPYVVNLAGPATATSVTFIVWKSQTTTLGGTLTSLLGAVISPFIGSPAGIVIDCWAALPTS